MNKALTPTMKRALALAGAHGGRLYRHRGGYWAGPDRKLGDAYVSTHTVRGLHERGLLSYSRFMRDRAGQQWPVEAVVHQVDGIATADTQHEGTT